jgi:hypothetical protein
VATLALHTERAPVALQRESHARARLLTRTVEVAHAIAVPGCEHVHPHFVLEGLLLLQLRHVRQHLDRNPHSSPRAERQPWPHLVPAGCSQGRYYSSIMYRAATHASRNPGAEHNVRN